MIVTGPQIRPILVGLIVSTRLFDGERATLSAPQFWVWPFIGASVSIRLLTLYIELKQQEDTIC